MDVGALNALFAIPGHLHFETGEGGLTKAVVDNAYARCEIYLHGAHVTSFKPHDADELLWLSSTAVFAEGRAVRGGVPVCWPWFGPHPSDTSKPQHGFARSSHWTLFGTTVNAMGETVVRLGLQDNEASRALFPHAFTLSYAVTVGKTLGMELTTANDDDMPFTLSQALHTYLKVDAVENVRIEGFAGKRYTDKLQDGRECVQEGDIVISRDVDRVYEDADPSCLLTDGTRSIEVSKSGSVTTVVWNPWAEKAAAMGDFDNDGYLHMVCIEAANAGEDVRSIAPGGTHTLTQRITSRR